VGVSVFEATTAKQLFGKHKNTVKFWWGPLHIVFKTNEKWK
jgi:hypothetical protein